MNADLNNKQVSSYFHLVLILVIAVFIVYAYYASYTFGFQNVDDAYISFTYGKNLMQGNGLVYNAGEHVEGYTNFLWTVLTSPFTLISFADISVFTSIIGVICAITALVILAKTQKTLARPQGIIFMVFPVILLAFDNAFVFWAISGMEFALFALLIILVYYSYTRLRDDESFVNKLIIYSILAMLCRPEGNLLFACIIFNMFVFRKSFNNFTGIFKKMIFWYGLAAVLYYSFKYFYYGSVLPNTFYAKGVTDTELNLVHGIAYLKQCFKPRLLIFLPILFLPYRTIFKDYKLNFLFFFCIIYMLYIVYVGGDWTDSSRFIVPILPLIVLLSALGLNNLYIKLTEKLPGYKKILLPCFIVTMFFITGYNSVSTFRKLDLVAFTTLSGINFEKECTRIGLWLAGQTNPSIKVAVGPAGKIAYYGNKYCIDMWGLCDPHISKLEIKQDVVAHRKFDLNYILSKKPTYVIGYAGFTDKDMPDNYLKIQEATLENGYLPIFKLQE